MVTVSFLASSCYMCTVLHSLLTLTLGATGSLCFVTMTLPRRRFCTFIYFEPLMS